MRSTFFHRESAPSSHRKSRGSGAAKHSSLCDEYRSARNRHLLTSDTSEKLAPLRPCALGSFSMPPLSRQQHYFPPQKYDPPKTIPPSYIRGPVPRVPNESPSPSP